MGEAMNLYMITFDDQAEPFEAANFADAFEIWRMRMRAEAEVEKYEFDPDCQPESVVLLHEGIVYRRERFEDRQATRTASDG